MVCGGVLAWQCTGSDQRQSINWFWAPPKNRMDSLTHVLQHSHSTKHVVNLTDNERWCGVCGSMVRLCHWSSLSAQICWIECDALQELWGKCAKTKEISLLKQTIKAERKVKLAIKTRQTLGSQGKRARNAFLVRTGWTDSVNSDKVSAWMGCPNEGLERFD